MKINRWTFGLLRARIMASLIAVVFISNAVEGQSVRPAPAAEVSKVTTDLPSGDRATQSTAVEQIKSWLTRGWVSQSLWRQWLPTLVNAGRHQDVADLALLGLLGRPGPEGIIPLLNFRAEAFIALDKADDALQAAKSYYNVCDIKLTSKAVDMLGVALAKAHPTDGEIVRRFRAQQADAAVGKASDQPGLLSAIKIDTDSYDAAIQRWAGKTRFVDRVGYANLLLAADKCADAEKTFRELFQLASTQDELTQATEGIAKALRAEDGNVGRANAWLISMQKGSEGNATTPQSVTTHPN